MLVALPFGPGFFEAFLFSAVVVCRLAGALQQSGFSNRALDQISYQFNSFLRNQGKGQGPERLRESVLHPPKAASTSRWTAWQTPAQTRQ